MTSWADTHVLVTGASSGAGLATAVLLARKGAHLSLLARDAGRLETAAEVVSAARLNARQRVTTHMCDVADAEQVLLAVKHAEEAHGPVDTLAACAGYCIPARFAETDVADFDAHVGTNLLGVIYAARAVAPGMIERGRGHIAMIGSMGGLVGVYGYSAYSAAKFGVTGFAEVLRCELKVHGIGVTLLVPPNMDTPGYARELAVEPPETAAINGIARTWAPERIAEVFVHGIERNRFLVLPGLTNKLLYRAEGLWPELFFGIFDRTVARARRTAVSAHA